MNQQVRHLPTTTQEAEGLPRRRWTVAEIEKLCEQGVFGGTDRPRERFELIGGEIVPMNAKGAVHEVIKMELQRYWFPLVASLDVSLVTETTLRYAPDGFLEPDFFFWPRSIHLREISCPTALLLVEVADTSLAYDTGRKSAIYANLGLREYWVIDANTLVTKIHLAPGAGGYSSIANVASTERLSPTLLPQIALRLADLGLEPLRAS